MGPMMEPRRITIAAVLVALLAACGGSSGSPTAAGSSPTDARTPTPVPATPSPAATATAEPTPEPIGDEPPPLTLTSVAEGLNAPISLEVTPDGWLFVNERNGRVVAVDPETGDTSVALDITDRVLGGGEQGLLGLAVHPEWAGENLRAFVHYSDRNGDTVVSEFRVTDLPLPPRLDPGTERVLLRVDQPYANHNGGQLAFGPDGYLYLGLGDGGDGGDPHGHGQDTATLLGSILRIDVDAGDPYGIPEGNPFADGEGGAPEIFLYGLRNPWRFSFDRETGLLWIGDVGQNAYEEVSRVDPVADAGANLGWNRMEASHCFVSGCSDEGLTLPVAEYAHDAGCSVTGGYVYRGSAINGLRGWYLFSDYCSGLLFGLRSDATGVSTPALLLETGLSVSAFGQGPDGELYLADITSGGIYRIDAAG
jgi:glucose/arabinose dehydrogenase